MDSSAENGNQPLLHGRVVKLDRGYPLIKLDNGSLVRCKHATGLVKTKDMRAVIGDYVMVSAPSGHEHVILAEICPRKNTFIRKDPAETSTSQVLAANFEVIIVAQPLLELNTRRLERELVLAFETGARVVVALTKADAALSEHDARRVSSEVQERAGKQVTVLVLSQKDNSSAAALLAQIAPGETAVLIGRSGVGKSSLVNLLCKADVAQTGSVRAFDGKGRHTTVSREIIELPNGGFIVDMPGVRGLGMWESEEGIGAAFEDIELLAAQCKFGDCKHENEPGCAVLEAVARGEISQTRLDSYKNLMNETRVVRERKEKARWAAKEGRPSSGGRASAGGRPSNGGKLANGHKSSKKYKS